jgi:hypothetical protein
MILQEGKVLEQGMDVIILVLNGKQSIGRVTNGVQAQKLITDK